MDNSVEFLGDLLKISSVSGNEQEISAYLTTFLQKNGFTIIPSDVGNAIGIKGHGSPVLLLSSHMDTVPLNNPYREEIVDGEVKKIYAAGATDCKPALASIFYSGAKSDEFNTKSEGTLILAGIVQEEIATIGIEDLFLQLGKQNITPDYAIFGEPTVNDRICVGYRGRVLVDLEITTEQGHSSNPWAYDNPVDVFMQYFKQIEMYAKKFNVDHPNPAPQMEYFHTISAALTTLHSGDTHNVLPGSAKGTIDVRIPLEISAEKLVADLTTILSKDYLVEKMKYAPKQDISIEVKFSPAYDAVESPQNNPVVNALRWAAFKTLGNRKIKLLKKTGSTFTNLIQTHYIKFNPHFACITYGPGDPKLEHSNKEFIEISEYKETIEIYTKFFPKLSLFHEKYLSKLKK